MQKTSWQASTALLIASSLCAIGCNSGGAGPIAEPSNAPVESANAPAGQPGNDAAELDVAEIDVAERSTQAVGEQPAGEPGESQPTAGADQRESGASDESLWTRKRGNDWPRFLGPKINSSSTEKGLDTQRIANPKIVWRKMLGVSYGAGAISKGRYFQFDRFGDMARVYCLNAETGKELWRFEYPTSYEDLYQYNGGPRCSPLVDGDRLYTYGADGMLHCLNAYTGKSIWEVDTAKKFGFIQNFFGVGSNPVIVGDLLIVMVGGSPEEDKQLPPGRASGNGTGIVAFEKTTGEVKYKLSDELASYASLVAAKIDGRDWCFAFARGGLLAFEPTKGKLDFHYPWRARVLESVNASVPVVVGDEVLISETYGPGSSLLKVRPGKFDVVWSDDPRKREKSLQTHWNTPVYLDGHVYACSGRHTYNAELRCVEWKTGKVKWTEPGLTRTSLLYVDGHFLCMGEDGILRLLKADPDNYHEVAKAPLLGDNGEPLLEYPCWAAPVVSHGLLYIRGKGRLLCLDLIPEAK